MTQTTSHYLQDSQLLSTLLVKVNELKKWNSGLRECLLKIEPALVAHCEIANISDCILMVMINNPHWLTRFRFHIPDLLANLRQYPGFEGLQSIQYKAKPPGMIPQKKKAPLLSPAAGAWLQQIKLRLKI